MHFLYKTIKTEYAAIYGQKYRNLLSNLFCRILLRLFLQWQDNRKRDRIVFAGGGDCAPVESDNILCDGQAQSCAARIGSAGFILPVKPF